MSDKPPPSTPAKPQRKRTAAKGRHAFHTCWHHDAWQGILGMPAADVGVYWRIILLINIRKAALRDNDVELAQLCHEPLARFRRIKARLIAAGRVIQDLDNGLLYDERSVRELVDSGFFSETQTKRAMRRATATPVLTVIDERSDFGDSAENVVAWPLGTGAQSHSKLGPKVAPNYGAKSFETRAQSPVDIDTTSPKKQALSVQLGHANQYPIPNKPSQPVAKSPKPRRQRAALPPTGGGAPVAPTERDREAWLASQRAALMGKDDAPTKPTPARKPPKGKR